MTYDIDIPDSPLERALLLQNTLVSRATGGSFDEAIYSQLRSEFMGNTSTRALLPSFVRTCRDGEQLWGHFRSVSYGTGSYQERRDYIYETFLPLLEHLEGTQATPSDPGITETLSSFDPDVGYTGHGGGRWSGGSKTLKGPSLRPAHCWRRSASVSWTKPGRPIGTVPTSPNCIAGPLQSWTLPPHNTPRGSSGQSWEAVIPWSRTWAPSATGSGMLTGRGADR